MEVRTFTNFWNMERKIYSIYDISLPVPVSLKVVGAFLITGIPWWLLLFILQVPFNNPFYLLYIIVPIPAAVAVSRPIFQRKTVTQFVGSLLKYYNEPKRLAGLRNLEYPLDKKTRLTFKVFTRTPLTSSKENK